MRVSRVVEEKEGNRREKEMTLGIIRVKRKGMKTSRRKGKTLEEIKIQRSFSC